MTLRLAPELEEGLRERAQVTQRSQASLIEEALRLLLTQVPLKSDRLPEPAIPYQEMPLLSLRNGINAQSILADLRAERLP